MNNGKPMPNDTDHPAFDAHFLRAIAQEGNSRWYLRPKINNTSLSQEELRKNVQALLQKNIDPLPGKRLVQHLSHIMVEQSARLHLQCRSVDDMLLEIRSALIQVAQGEFMIDSKNDPLYQISSPVSKPYRLENDTFEMRSVRVLKANRLEKEAAISLTGNPNMKDDITLGTITDSLRRTVPHLFSLETGGCSELAFPLRQKLHKLIGEEKVFTPELRVECAYDIVSYWNTIQPPEAIEEAINRVMRETGGEDPLDITPQEMIDQYLNPVLKSPEQLKRRLPLLETATMNLAWTEDSAQDCARMSAIWETIFPNTGLAMCDAQSNILAYMAAVARGRSLDKFRDILGPPSH